VFELEKKNCPEKRKEGERSRRAGFVGPGKSTKTLGEAREGLKEGNGEKTVQDLRDMGGGGYREGMQKKGSSRTEDQRRKKRNTGKSSFGIGRDKGVILKGRVLAFH